MTKTRDELLALLNCDGALVNLQKLVREELLPPTGDDVNNQIHTTYSFSPYSPHAAVYFARMAGLGTCGLMDHDSIAGAQEFLQAAAIVGMAATIGMECRASFKNTPFADRRINNPDQERRGLHGHARRAPRPRRGTQRPLRPPSARSATRATARWSRASTA